MKILYKMYEIDELKSDYSDKMYRSLCQACLSSDRSLFSIEEYIDIYQNISNSSNVRLFTISSLFIYNNYTFDNNYVFSYFVRKTSH